MLKLQLSSLQNKQGRQGLNNTISKMTANSLSSIVVTMGRTGVDDVRSALLEACCFCCDTP